MEELFNNIENSILICSKNFEIVFCNNLFLQNLKYSIDDLKGKKVNDFILKSRLSLDEIYKYNKEKEIDFIFFNVDREEIGFRGKIIYSNIFVDEKYIIILKNEYISTELKTLRKYMWIKGNEGEASILERLDTENDILKKVSKDNEVECDNSDKYKRNSDNWKNNYKELTGILEKEVGKWKHNLKTTRDFIYNSSNTVNIEKILNNIKYELLEKLGCDGFNIYIYDEDSEYLSRYLSYGDYLNVEGDLEHIYISRDMFKACDYSDEMDKILSVEEVSWVIDREFLLERKIKYIGNYKIKFNGEFLGIFSVVYYNFKSCMQMDDCIVKVVSNQIGALISADRIFNKFNEEILKRKKAEKELQSILATAADIMVKLDNKGIIRKVNLGWKSASVGWSKEELLSKELLSFAHPDEIEAMRNQVKFNKKDSLLVKNVNKFRCKNGEYKLLDWRLVYIKESDMWIVTAKDITEEKRLEDERQKYEKAFQLESIKNEFLANMSHEFKTPLNIILSTIQMINYGIENGNVNIESSLDIEKYLKSIKQNSYRILRLANNIIDMTKIDGGYYNLELENHEIVSLVEDVVTSVADYVNGKNITITFDTEIEEFIIACDYEKVERILLNLISNSIKYTGAKGKIEVFLSINEYVCISVKDNGIGIAQEELDTIFDRFMQVDNIYTRKVEGSGIGLSLVKSLVDMHQGKIEVVSELGVGSKFTFMLPIKKVSEEVYKEAKKIDLLSKVDRCNIEFSDIYDL
ncbi:MAG: PAS domain S-box protein [Clostridium sp.]|nr:PAS domain S-box protein [Clostridium sp.]